MKASFKKMIAMGLVVVMAVGTLTGCGGSSDNKKSSSDGGSDVASGSSADAGQAKEKKTFDDLGGIKVSIGDWYYTEPTKKTDYIKARADYWKQIQKDYNFEITRNADYSFGDQKDIYVNDVIANNPSEDLYYLYQTEVSEPLLKGLMYDLGSLPEFDFREEKWNPTVVELMSIGDGIWGMNTLAEPRGGLFYNKRLFKDAGIDPEEPYDLQAEGKWTWDKFEEYCKKLTKDTDKDGKTDQYAMASFSKDYLPMCAANNDATFISRNGDNGEYVNAIGTDNFLNAMNWGMDLMKKGYIMPKPKGAAWDWFLNYFRDADVAMQTAEVYQIQYFDTMDDEYGFVMFPYNQDNPNATNKTIPNDNIIVMPSCLDKDRAEKVAFAYDLYTEPIEGYDPTEAYKEDYYAQFKDDRAVDETITMMAEEEHKMTSYLPMIADVDYGDFCYAVYAGAVTPAKKIEELSSKWDSKIKKANDNYKKFTETHS